MDDGRLLAGVIEGVQRVCEREGPKVAAQSRVHRLELSLIVLQLRNLLLKHHQDVLKLWVPSSKHDVAGHACKGDGHRVERLPGDEG